MTIIYYLKITSDDVLTLSADHVNRMRWHIDAAFNVHPDFKSFTGDAIISVRRKQKLNPRSSTEAEVGGVDGVARPMLWAGTFSHGMRLQS